MKEMEIIYLKTEEIVPYENNPRHNEEAVEPVANSIREFGFKVPIIVDENNVIVAGHTRLKAAERLGLKEVPCIKATDLTEDQVKAFRLADNKVGELATWDAEKLNIELEDIELDMSSFGFEDITVDDDWEDIDDEGNGGTISYEHKLRIDNTEVIMTDEEYEQIIQRYNQFVDANGVSFGFVASILEGGND